jgi:hypothetical protein
MFSPTAPVFGQIETFTAALEVGAGAGTPPGDVTFTIDGVAQPPVPLSIENGVLVAVFSTSTLSPGDHTIVASYGGDAQFSPSFSSAVIAVVPALADGPTVMEVDRFGYHDRPTTLVLTFNQLLDTATAQDVKNYEVIGPAGRIIGIKSAIYNATLDTVTLHPRERINIHHRYTLIVDGTAPDGLKNAQGEALDGAKSGEPGSDYRGSLTWRNLVLDPPSSGHAQQTMIINKRAKAKAHAITHKAVPFTRPQAFRQ